MRENIFYVKQVKQLEQWVPAAGLEENNGESN
jgi:hypothetical protein